MEHWVSEGHSAQGDIVIAGINIVAVRIKKMN